MGDLRIKNDDQPPDDPALGVACPVCEAAPQERCHVQPGVLRLESHLERMELAAEVKNERLAETRQYKLLAVQRNRRRFDNR